MTSSNDIECIDKGDTSTKYLNIITEALKKCQNNTKDISKQLDKLKFGDRLVIEKPGRISGTYDQISRWKVDGTHYAIVKL